MILKLDIERVRTIDAVRDFMAGSEPVDFHLTDRRGAYDFVTRTLRRLNYARLTKADKGVVGRFVAKVTGLSRAQSTRLIGQYQNTGHIRDRRGGATRPFERRYTAADIRLLAEVDETLGGLCGPTTRRVMRRQYEVFGDERFERLAGLSNSHLYRMRQSTTYRRRRNRATKTQATQVNIGERRKPHPQGRPGFLRVDSVHQGDLDGRKGVYEVNLVDEVTQYEFVAAVEGISERFLVPALEALIEAFPFEVKGFHADNGSEYINYRVARLLRKLHVEEFTKSRPFPVETTDSKGRTRKTYPLELTRFRGRVLAFATHRDVGDHRGCVRLASPSNRGPGAGRLRSTRWAHSCRLLSPKGHRRRRGVLGRRPTGLQQGNRSVDSTG